MDDRKEEAATPLVAPYDEADNDAAPKPVDTEAPVSTDRQGDKVDLPDLGGKID